MASEHNRKVEKLLDTYLRVTKSKMLHESKQETAKKWLNQRKMNTTVRRRKRDQILGKDSNVGTIQFGHMYFFKYHAKTKKKLDYWDEYPLIIPFSNSGGLIYGINLHYIPPRIRAGVIDMFQNKDGLLIPLASTVKSMADNPIFKPAIHSYYRDLMIGNVQKIEPEDWENILFLPLAKFRSDTNKDHSLQKVYSDYYSKM